MFLFVSGKKRIVIIVAKIEINAAIKNGICVPNPTVKAEIAGPKKNPKPNDAPIIPNPFARLCDSFVSEMTAATTGILPAVIPSRARAKKRKIAFGATASNKKEVAVPAIEVTKSGFLPYLSERRPIIGAEKNEHRKKVDKRRAF